MHNAWFPCKACLLFFLQNNVYWSQYMLSAPAFSLADNAYLVLDYSRYHKNLIQWECLLFHALVYSYLFNRKYISFLTDLWLIISSLCTCVNNLWMNFFKTKKYVSSTICLLDVLPRWIFSLNYSSSACTFFNKVAAGI